MQSHAEGSSIQILFKQHPEDGQSLPSKHSRHSAAGLHEFSTQQRLSQSELSSQKDPTGLSPPKQQFISSHLVFGPMKTPPEIWKLSPPSKYSNPFRHL
jgi:hypothetical protein